MVGSADEPMDEDAKEERVEKPVTEANSPDEEVERGERKETQKAEEEKSVKKKSSEEQDEGAAKKEEEMDVDEKGPNVKEKDKIKERPKSQTENTQEDKEPARKAPISSFFGERICIALCLHKKSSVCKCAKLLSARRDSNTFLCPETVALLTF